MLKCPKSLEMQERARKLIPGKTQLLSKRPEMFAPGVWPGYYQKAKGQCIWDLDGNEYLDFSIGGIGANILGYADDDVDNAVVEAIRNGSSSSLCCREEIELAELLTEIHPWSHMVRYTRSGGEAMAVAVRIARASSGRDVVAFCGYHGWHDWYLSANIENGTNLNEHLLPGLSPLGVAPGLEGSAIPFKYNDIEALKKIVSEHRNRLAAIVMEPIHNMKPENRFLESVRAIADENNIVLVFDEITSAFRVNPGGAHLQLGVEPDIAVFSKAISNGYPMAVILGKEAVMQTAQDTFISSTSWTERIGPVAALATIKKYQQVEVHSHLLKIGENVRAGLVQAAENTGLGFEVEGLAPLLNFRFLHSENLAMRTFFVQEMLGRGFLASGRFYAMYAHSFDAVDKYLEHVNQVFGLISTAVAENNIRDRLRGEIAHSGFIRLN